MGPITPASDQPQYMPIKNKSAAATCVSITGWGILTLILTLSVLLSTIAFTIVLSMQTEDVSSQMVVLTGHRTRDWSSANSYSMHSSDEDRYTRLYVCMLSAEFIVPDNPTYSSLQDFRDKAKNHHDCGAESDGGWPRDYGFLRCIQSNFDSDFHKSNVFLKCLDLSEGIMVETIQTPASTLFLGSFNYVTLLLASMGIMSAFLLFTAGGICVEDGLKTDMHQVFIQDQEPKWVRSGYTYVAASQGWAPLAALPVTLALSWSLVMFVASMIYTFPPKDIWSDTVAVAGGGRVLPGTPWTGFMCAGMSMLMMVYFTSCLVEWYGDRGERTAHVAMERMAQQKIDNDRAAAKSAAYLVIRSEEAAAFARQAVEAAATRGTAQEDQFSAQAGGVVNPAMRQWASNARRSNQMAGTTMRPTPPAPPPPPIIVAPPAKRKEFRVPSANPVQKTRMWDIPSSGASWGSVDSVRNATFNASGSAPPSFMNPADPTATFSTFSTTSAYMYHPTNSLGIRYNTQLHYDDDSTARVTPLLNKAFALTWVFADGLLFLGMLNGQNSLLNENVVAIWYYIIQCRGFQLAATYFMDDVLFSYNPLDQDKNAEIKSYNGGTGTDQFDDPERIGRWRDRAGLKANLGLKMFKDVRPDSDEANWYPNEATWHPDEYKKWGPSFVRGVAEKQDKGISQMIHAGIAAACSQLASLWCMVIVVFNFFSALSIPLALNSNGVGNPTHALQISFITFIILMEAARHTIAFLTIFGKLSQRSYLNAIQIVFFLDWLLRYSFIVATIFTVPVYLGDRNMALYSYLL